MSKKSLWQKTAGWAVALLGLAGVLFLLWRMLFSGPPPVRWVTQKVTRGDLRQVVSATGTLQPVVLSPVGAQVSGIVWKIHADYNQLVKKGQILVELDPALFQAAVRQQSANLASAQALLAKAQADAFNAKVVAGRARALVAKNYISLADRDTAVAQERAANAAVLGAEAGVKLAQASLDKSQLDLKNSVILSPVDGIVIARSIELGQAVVASFQAPNLFTIAEDLSKMQVLANVDEADIGHVRIGETAEFTVDAFRNRRFYGQVGQIRNAAQTVSNVVTYIVVVDVNNKDLLLRPGMTANVRLEVAKRNDALLIPSAALRFKPRLDQLTGKAAAATERQPGRRSGEWRERRERREREANQHPDGGTKNQVDQRMFNSGTDFLERGSPATVYVARGEQLEPLSITIGITDGVSTEVKTGLEDGQAIVLDAVRPAASASGIPTGSPPRPPGGGGFRRGGL